jgi:hypothetical protein
VVAGAAGVYSVIHDINYQLIATGATAMIVEQAVERYARDRMADGELLTWHYDRQTRHATLFVSDHVELMSYPTCIAGVPTSIRQLPRPLY